MTKTAEPRISGFELHRALTKEENGGQETEGRQKEILSGSAMTTLTIAPEYQAVIRQALASLSLGRPSGRVTLSVTFNVHNSKVGSIHIDTHSHEEVRL